MSTRQIASRGLAVLLAVAGAAIASPADAGSVSYEILVDTSGLSQGSGGYIDISLNPTIAQSPATVAVQVFNPITDGTLGVANTVNGTATGDLTTPMGVTADNTATMNELTQSFSVSSFFDVFVTLSGPEIGTGATGPWSGTMFNLSIFDSQVGAVALMPASISTPTWIRTTTRSSTERWGSPRRGRRSRSSNFRLFRNLRASCS